MMKLTDILKILPHRYPMLLVDKVLEIKEDEITCLKNVTFNENFFQGHFPGAPVMPGVLQIEALAQAAGIFAFHNTESAADKIVFFMSIDKVKFRKPVEPGDTLILKCKVISIRRGIIKVDAWAEVDGKKVCEGQLTAMVVDKEQ